MYVRTTIARLSSSSRSRHRVSPFIRLRAWWLGLDNAELLARYGERGFLRTIWMEWSSTLVIMGCVISFMVGRFQSGRSNEILENIEFNRQRYYKRDFSPPYTVGAPDAVYDGVRGYCYIDDVSGLRINSDNRIVSHETREELKKRVDQVEITPSMVRDAQQLLSSPRYQRSLNSQ
ncbi:unnamed protein product [Phytomonas sp. Hart1]|nr:unnamed protein product [Phytomonas sp. Hart1]|eukprot:CCW67520.1 unnamed protein product [Phytomonas sp. isolate Hart1]